MSDKLQRARHIRSNPPDPTDRNAAPRNNPRANAEARIPARGRHRGVDRTLLRPPTDPGATGLIPVVGSHAGLDRTIPGATSEASIRQQKVIVAEAAEAEAAGRGGASAGKLSAESVGASAALISICVIISRITGFARTWAMAFALGSTFVSSSYQVANNLPNMLYELVMGGMLITAFLPVYLSVKKQLGDRRGNEYASNLLTIVVVLLAIVSVLCMVFAGQIIYTQSFYSEPGRDGAGGVLLPVLLHPDCLLRRLLHCVGPSEREPRISVVLLRTGVQQPHRHRLVHPIRRHRPDRSEPGLSRHRHRQPPRRLHADGLPDSRAQEGGHPPAPPHRLARSGAGRHAAPRRARGVRHGVLVRHGVGPERRLLRVRGQRPFGHRLRTAVVHASRTRSSQCP